MRRTSVAVGSTNPVKIDAVRLAFETLWPEQLWEIRALPIDSGVASQPMSDWESIMGARNRAKGALHSGDAAYGVGLEGGLQQIGEWWFDSGWTVVMDRNGHEGIGSTAKLAVPPQMITMILQGMEVGEAVDAIFQQQNSKQSHGHFGLMTKNTITRTKAYTDGVLTALARFVHPHIFDEKNQ
ncbi:MAG TPA: inosine/xanthosine triphosphatase [Ktedonobacteraceae bacterium]|jgi:inosine/xanthosine triphosphatase|nr:inosine/xanthosine triphosphatase [Ktedonobacteraceae bacterium]